MFRPHLLPIGLITLLLTSPALTTEPATPQDPFYDISKLAQRPPEPPICCLVPLPSSEPAEEILSFEDWKMKQEQEAQQQQGQSDGARPKEATSKPSVNSGFHSQSDTHPEASFDAPPPLESPVPPPHFQVPLTDRFNYANSDCSARVHYSHKSARQPSSLLSSKKDRYMLSPCSTPGEDKFVVVELCDDIRIDTVQLANFEFFSGVFKDFSVSVAKTYTTDPERWTPAGTYRAKNIRGVQSFHPASLPDFYRFIRIDFHSNFGSEFYCPVSLLRVFGLTHLEQWKWELWEAEYKEKHAEAISPRSIESGTAPAVEEVKERTEKAESTRVPGVFSVKPISSHPETVDLTISATKTSEPVPIESTLTSILSPLSFLSETPTANGLRKSTTEPTHVSHTGTSYSDFSDPSEDSNGKMSISSIPTTPSSDPISSQNPPLSQSTSDPSLSQSDSLTSTQISNTSSSDPSPKPSVSTTISALSSPVPTIVPHESRSVPSVVATGESIYRTIMTKLSLLEGNSTLYLRYVEEQTRSLRDALMRLEEDVGRLEGIGKAQTQSFQKVINELDRQRRRLEREQSELQTRVDYLTDEVVLEKRLGIAQLCLLLIVLVFMALTRGSRGEPFMVPISNGRRDSLREWGRRHLSSLGSGEWASKLRTSSPSPLPKNSMKSPLHDKKSDKVRFPTERRREDGSRTPQRSSTTLAVPVSVKGRTPADIRAPHPRHFISHRPRTPTSASFSGFAHSRIPATAGSYSSPGPSGAGQGSARPRLRRVSSHNPPAAVAHSLSVGEVASASPLSAKKWAKSAHLHEIRKMNPKAGTDSSSQKTLTVSTVDTKTIQVQLDTENFPDTIQTDSDMKNISSDSGNRYRNRERSRDGAPREPLSTSPLQNRLREQDERDLASYQLDSSCQPNGAPKIIDLDTESESWVDTDIESSEVGQDDSEVGQEDRNP